MHFHLLARSLNFLSLIVVSVIVLLVVMSSALDRDNCRLVRQDFLKASKDLHDACIGAYYCIAFNSGLPALITYYERINWLRLDFLSSSSDYLALLRGRDVYEGLKHHVIRFKRLVRSCFKLVASEIFRLKNY